MDNGVGITVHTRNVEGSVRFMQSLKIPDQVKKDIEAFKNWGFRQGLSEGRVQKYVQVISRLAQITKKDFRTATREDYEKMVDSIIQDKGLSEWTRQTYKVCLKKFAWWVENERRREAGEEELESGEYPKSIKWLKTTMKKNIGYNGVEIPKELITEEETVKLIKACFNPRDKALIAILFETGVRASELLSMRIGDVELEGKLGHITVKGKTGQRRIPFNWARPYLREWINAHPDPNTKAAPVWAGLMQSDYMRYHYLLKLLKLLNKRSKVGKTRMFPHLFRHSAATRLARIFTMAQLCDYMGWNQGSRMAAVYIHAAGLNTDDSFAQAHGIQEESPTLQESPLRPKKCPNCNTEFPSDFTFCGKCGSPLTMEDSMKFHKKVEKINRIALQLSKGEISEEDARMATSDILLRSNGKIRVEGTWEDD